MGRVAGSTLKNGWTHVMWFQEIDYGNDAGLGVDQGADSGDVANGGTSVGDGLTAGAPAAGAERYAMVVSPDGGPVKLRKSGQRGGNPFYWLGEPRGARGPGGARSGTAGR